MPAMFLVTLSSSSPKRRLCGCQCSMCLCVTLLWVCVRNVSVHFTIGSVWAWTWLCTQQTTTLHNPRIRYLGKRRRYRRLVVNVVIVIAIVTRTFRSTTTTQIIAWMSQAEWQRQRPWNCSHTRMIRTQLNNAVDKRNATTTEKCEKCIQHSLNPNPPPLKYEREKYPSCATPNKHAHIEFGNSIASS